MRVLLSTIGSRGDVQPLVALAVELRNLQCDVRLCVPPDFREWIEGLELGVTPIGPELRATGRTNARMTLSAEQRRQMIEGCIAIDEVNLQRLFTRVAAVVHHGGAGTTTAATRAGAPQFVIPQHYDQDYFARRVEELGIGVAHSSRDPRSDTLAAELHRVLEPAVKARAESIASRVGSDGAAIAAKAVQKL